MIISVGKSRKSKNWNKIELSWLEFVESLKKPIITDETQEEYFNMEKSKQDDIKDVGGFVGGELIDGFRRTNNVLNRCILTLDADYANEEITEFLETYFEFSYCVFSTHKYTKHNPRYRLIIPLSRTCDNEEYEALGRQIANQIDINMFDDTTYQPHRLMYYPSVSKDGEYIFKFRDTFPLDVDKTLELYDDWRDRSQWYVSDREKNKIRVHKHRQQDPRDKGGIIGAFCRVYDVRKVIEEYLYDVYSPCSDDRYTYIKGSTYGGVLIYDNGLFTYSNHATDPTSGRLCNAFDLLRIHLYGHLDEKFDKKTNLKYLPSFKIMSHFIIRNKKIDKNEIKSFIKKESKLKYLGDHVTRKNATFRKTVECDFKALRNSVTWLIKKRSCNAKLSGNDIWKSKLKYNKKNVIKPSIENIEIILSNDKNLKDKFKIDTFNNKTWIIGSIPWDKSNTKRQWEDSDDSGLRLYLEKNYEINHRNNTYDAYGVIVKKNSFNSVLDYLNSLNYDGINRLDTLFIDYLGVEDNIYSRSVTRKSLVGAVARIFEPGVKLDTSIVLVGDQGVGKSQIIKRLGKEWYSDSITTLKGREAYEQIQGNWIIEIAELAAMKRVEIETIKQFMSKQEDNFRSVYARNTKSHKRQCIFICTTNDRNCLRDTTGNRRFLPLDVDANKAKKNIWKDLNAYEVDQIWAEAVKYYKAGESLILDKEANAIAKQQQESHTKHNPLEGIVNEYLDMPVPDDWYEKDVFQRINYIRNEKKLGKPRDKISVIEVWCELLEGDKKDLNMQKSREIGDLIIKGGNWIRSANPIRFGYYGRQRAFKRKNLG